MCAVMWSCVRSNFANVYTYLQICIQTERDDFFLIFKTFTNIIIHTETQYIFADYNTLTNLIGISQLR